MTLTPQSKTKIEAPITKPELVDYASCESSVDCSLAPFVAMPIFPSPRNHRPSGSGA